MIYITDIKFDNKSYHLLKELSIKIKLHASC